MRTILAALALIALIVIPPAFAGSATTPELSDSSDIAQASLDIRKGWWESDASALKLTIRVQDLVGSPLDAGDVGWLYTAQFDSSQGWIGTFAVRVVAANAQGATVRVGSAWAAAGVSCELSVTSSPRAIACSASLDPATDDVKISVARAVLPDALPSGTIVHRLFASTYSLAAPIDAAETRTLRDTGVGAFAYVVI